MLVTLLSQRRPDWREVRREVRRVLRPAVLDRDRQLDEPDGRDVYLPNAIL